MEKTYSIEFTKKELELLEEYITWGAETFLEKERLDLIRMRVTNILINEPIKEINKTTAIFVQDQDCHWYCIHESDKERFYKMCEEAYAKDDFDEFNKEFSMIGMDPNSYREKYLK